MANVETSSFRVGSTAATIAVAAIGAAALAYLLNRRTRVATLAAATVSDYREAGRVEQLFVYPLKSCKGVSVS